MEEAEDLRGAETPEGRPEDDAEGASFELWKRSLRGRGAAENPGEDAGALEKVLEKMVSLSELMGELEEDMGNGERAKEPLLVVPGHGARSTLSIDTLDRWIEIERRGR